MSILRRNNCCPWWMIYFFDNRIRRLFQKPEDVVGPYLKEGMTALDLGCGMGFLSVEMARRVGATGRVITVDLQREMLDGMRRRALRAGVFDRIHMQQCDPDDIKVTDEVDFAAAMWMVHEVPDQARFLTQVRDAMKPGARFLIIEPKMHVSEKDLQKTEEVAASVGFKVVDHPKIGLSRAVLLALLEEAA